MENLKKIRTPLRQAFTRNYNLIEAELARDPPNKDEIEDLYAFLEEKVKELEIADQNIQETIILDEIPEADYIRECEDIDRYREKFIRIRRRVGALYGKERSTHEQSVYADAESLAHSKKKFRLPKIEVPKFGGDLKDWLCFWSLYKKIHEDQSVEAEDKFHFLLQGIIPGSRARELVDSYPPTAENYPKVIESLKQRFGRDDLLVEVYVRELLRLVLQNAMNSREKIPITKLYDLLESHIRALDTLGVTSDKCAAMLYPLVESCLPEDTLRAWQRGSAINTASDDHDPLKNRLTKLLQFLRSEVEGEERIRMARAGFGLSAKKEKASKEKEVNEDIPTAAGLFAGENSSSSNNKQHSCIFCEKRHASPDCIQAQKMSMQDKKNCLYKRRACFVCLKSGHTGKECKLSVKCIVCSQKHFPIMCSEIAKQKEQCSKKDTSDEGKPSLANISNCPEVVLKTLMVKLNFEGQSRLARVVIDDGSHRSYILKRIADEMHYVSVGTEAMVHALFGGQKSNPVHHNKYEVPLTTLDGSYSCSLKLLDQQEICSSVPRVPRGPWLGELQKRKIWISDVGIGCPEIVILIGADAAGKIMTGRVCHLKSGLVAVETKLGWTLMGEVPGGNRSEAQALISMNLLSTEACISNLWRLDTIGITDPAEVTSRNDLEEAAKEHFLATTSVNEEGRYEVCLPWLEAHPPLASNRAVAERRLVSATNRLISSGYLESYSNVFKEWLELGIIEKVPVEELESFGHYLPPRAVIKEHSATTKVRPVFDAFSHEKNHPSLNDCLEKGPNLIEKIPVVIIRFRKKRIGVLADIAKAFLQMCLKARDRDFLRFLWWKDYATRKMEVLRHKRVVFGVSSSPFLLGACIELHLSNAPENMKSTAEQLMKAFYVDNVATSVDNNSELVQFMQDSHDLMAMGKFDLRGWESTVTDSAQASEENPEVPVLGLVWNKFTDTLRCEFDPKIDNGPVTKRKILSVAHKIFDPVGFTVPVTLQPKKLLQLTWEVKSGWDSELPSEITENFRKWSANLELLREVKVPRWIMSGCADQSQWGIHTFSDASKAAYAACVFLRVETRDGVSVQLVLAKSRVAPLKGLTIPRMELLSCLIGVRLTEVVKNSLEVPDITTTYWTDSSTALSWIQRHDQWGTFVGNRVKEIREFSEAVQWKHVPGVLNPADLPSRGCSVQQLLSSRWWEGPGWLKLSEEFWPKSVPVENEDEVNAEKRKTVVSMLCSEGGWDCISKYFQDTNSYLKIVRRIALLTRFFKWIRVKAPMSPELKLQELEEAEVKLLQTIQTQSFKHSPQNFMKGAAVFRGEDGLFRVKTRLTEADDSANFKFPVLLPASHRIVTALITELHLGKCHAGVQVLMKVLREKFWIIRSRKSIRSVISHCVRCS